MTVSEELYRLNGLEHYYHRKPAIRIDQLVIGRNQIIGLMGPNGSGKSTLLKLLAFVEKPSRGEIRFKGKPTEPFSRSIRSRVTLLTQTPYLMKRSVFDNIAYALKIRSNNHRPDDDVHQAMAWVGLSVSEFSQRRWHELSGGEAQRVALAARLVLKPEVLLLDEPTASVDANSARLIRKASLRARKEWGTTLVIATHDWQWLFEMCDDVLHLHRGRIFGTGLKNIISGSWQPVQNGLWEQVLEDNQRVVVTQPPSLDSVAVLDPGALQVMASSADKPAIGTCLDGVIARLTLEKQTGSIVATVTVANINLKARLSSTRVDRCRLYPGRKVTLYYDPRSIQWG